MKPFATGKGNNAGSVVMMDGEYIVSFWKLSRRTTQGGKLCWQMGMEAIWQGKHGLQWLLRFRDSGDPKLETGCRFKIYWPPCKLLFKSAVETKTRPAKSAKTGLRKLIRLADL